MKISGLLQKDINIDVRTSRNLITEAQTHKTAKGYTVSISSKESKIFHGATVLTERGRFSLAHEIGHILMNYLIKKCGNPIRLNQSKVSTFVGDHDIEIICNHIAGELLVPRCLFEINSFKNISKLLHLPIEETFIVSTEKAGSKILHISILEALRTKLQVSRLVLIQQLHLTKLLDETETGIIVSFYSINKNTGRSPAVRVRYSALPSWGFIPKNISIRNLGFLSALEVFERSPNGEVKIWGETLQLQENLKTSKIGSSKCWQNGKRHLDTKGEHVVISKPPTPKYMITVFGWPYSHSNLSIHEQNNK